MSEDVTDLKTLQLPVLGSALSKTATQFQLNLTLPILLLHDNGFTKVIIYSLSRKSKHLR